MSKNQNAPCNDCDDKFANLPPTLVPIVLLFLIVIMFALILKFYR